MPAQDRVAVVTGGAQGIGRAICHKLADMGAHVAIFDVNLEKARGVAEEVKRKGRRSLALAVDVSNWEQVSNGVQKVTDTFGKVEILVNNAGWTPPHLFLETPLEVWPTIIGINYYGTLNCCRAALDHMVPQQYGRIISVSSDAARAGVDHQAIYGGCKGAIISFSKCLAVEVARYKITVNVVCPASTNTDSLRAIRPPEYLERLVKAIPVGRLAEPEDQANAVAFFAADETDYITGQVLSVNGGINRLD